MTTQTSHNFRGYSKDYIQRQIEYEEAEGVHTYTMCDCGRMGCRSSKCAKCWKEELARKKSLGGQNG